MDLKWPGPSRRIQEAGGPVAQMKVAGATEECAQVKTGEDRQDDCDFLLRGGGRKPTED
jgi:hypothetical protein